MTEMQLAWVIKAILKALFLLPGGPIVGGLSGWLMLSRWRKTGTALIGLSLLSLYLFSTPGVSRLLLNQVEDIAPLTLDAPGLKRAQAIVVLSSGREYAVTEYGGKDQPDDFSRDRIVYGDWLRQRTGLPLLISGGMGWDSSDSSSIAEVMASYLVLLGKAPPAWLEERSSNTAENARFSADILKRNGIQTIVLVTHASHMPRAIASFEGSGLEVIPAPMGYRGTSHEFAAILAWLPNMKALRNSRLALHELIGRIWYGIANSASNT